MNTISAKADGVKRDWYVVDATDKTLGRLCAELAHRLRGKHKTIYTPHVDTGDNIIVLNAGKVRVTGQKLTDKFYHHHTGYMGGLKTTSLEKLLQKHPEMVRRIRKAGTEVHVWTVNTRADLDLCLELDVAAVITDMPGVMLQYLES